MGKVRLLLRSVYLKAHMDANKKTSDMSWEDSTIEALLKLVGGELDMLKRQENNGLSRVDMEEDLMIGGWNGALADVRERMNVLFQ